MPDVNMAQKRIMKQLAEMEQDQLRLASPFWQLKVEHKVWLCTSGLGKVKRKLRPITAIGPKQMEVDGRAFDRLTGKLWNAPNNTVFLMTLDGDAFEQVPEAVKEEVSQIVDEPEDEDEFSLEAEQDEGEWDDVLDQERQSADVSVLQSIRVEQGDGCWCGCGEVHGRRSKFLPGHDAKLKSRLIEWERTGDTSGIPEIAMVSLDTLFKGRFAR